MTRRMFAWRIILFLSGNRCCPDRFVGSMSLFRLLSHLSKQVDRPAKSVPSPLEIRLSLPRITCHQFFEIGILGISKRIFSCSGPMKPLGSVPILLAADKCEDKPRSLVLHSQACAGTRPSPGTAGPPAELVDVSVSQLPVHKMETCRFRGLWCCTSQLAWLASLLSRIRYL